MGPPFFGRRGREQSERYMELLRTSYQWKKRMERRSATLQAGTRSTAETGEAFLGTVELAILQPDRGGGERERP